MKKILFLIILISYSANGSEILKFNPGNSKYDDYTPTFRVSSSGMEIWMTSNKNTQNKRNRILEVYKLNDGLFKLKQNTSSMFERPIKNILNFDGSPCFAREVCENVDGLFVSNRFYNGKDRKNDIYEMKLVSGRWNVKYIDNINTDYWDDTPALSPKGDFMIFASDRFNPGTVKADLFYSKKVDGTWQNPTPLNNINTEKFSEESPFIDQSGNLYFTSNKEGDFDIYQVKLDKNGMPTKDVIPLKLKGVNKKGSNERNPSISPSNGWFMFASDRDTSNTNDDIYYTRIGSDYIHINLKVLMMTRNYEAMGTNFEDQSVPIATEVEVIDLSTNKISNFNSDENGLCEINILRRVNKKLEFDEGIRKIILKAKNADVDKYGNLITAIDTLVFNTWDKVEVEHNLYLWDTNSYYNTECEYNFLVKNVRFFVNAYWCPTSKAFSQYTPCTSMFIEEKSKIAPKKPTESNEIYNYNLTYEIENNKTWENCIDYRDFNTNNKTYSDEVDAAIIKLTDEMTTVFKALCIKRAIKQDKEIQVEVIGFTDPNPLYKKCHYLGADIAFDDNGIIIDGIHYEVFMDSTNKILYKNDTIPNMMKFNDTPFDGNQLLSDLRGIYSSILLDKVWYNKIPIYRNLKDKGLIVVKTRGEAINQEELDYAQRRSVHVKVTVPNMKPEKFEGVNPEAGSIVKINYIPCLNDK